MPYLECYSCGDEMTGIKSHDVREYCERCEALRPKKEIPAESDSCNDLIPEPKIIPGKKLYREMILKDKTDKKPEANFDYTS